MLKKFALVVGLAGCLGLMLYAAPGWTSSSSGNGNNQCQGDECKVQGATEINVGIGYTLKVDLDFDVCIDNGFAQDDKWNDVNALVYQEGNGNKGYITQYASAQAAILQLGNTNYADITQGSASPNNKALILQGENADYNYAQIQQFGSKEEASIVQNGDHNWGKIYQSENGVSALILQEGNWNFASIAQY